MDLPHLQWEHKIIRELHRKELARDHPEAKFRSEKVETMRLFDDNEEELEKQTNCTITTTATTTNSWNKPVF